MKIKFRIPRSNLICFLSLFIIACVSTPQQVEVTPLPEQDSFQYQKITPPKNRKLVAVAGFENKSTFSADKLWDTCSQLLTVNLVGSSYFRVVEWERMKQLFDWDMLASNSLVQSPESREKVRKILLCEYFVTGAVTSFDVSQQSTVSAMSKSKVIDTTIRVDLLLQDAQTGEYLSASTGEAVERQIFQGGLAGGQTGTWVSKYADKALNNAINKALYKLIEKYDLNTKQ